MAPRARRTYTAAEKAEALALYAEHGPREASRRSGIDAGTISRWGRAAGVETRWLETKGVAIQTSMLSMEQRKLNLASGLMDDIERLRAQLWAPCIERKIVTLSGGKDMSGTWEVADMDLDRPAFADQRAIMTSVAIAVDKVQILTGDVTARTETIDAGRDREQIKAQLGRVVEARALRLAS